MKEPFSIISSEPQIQLADNAATGNLRLLALGFEVFKYNLYSIWLFTYSDLKTIVGPMTAFGILSGLRANVFGMPSQPTTLVLSRIPLIAFWTWINLLPFAINNQRQPEAVEEDSVNKPWRPMPSKRVNPAQAKTWMLAFYVIAINSSATLGGLRQCLGLIFLGYWYNDLRGADRSPVERNAINACGFICYTSGALEVAYGGWVPLSLDGPLPQWLSVIAAVIFSTVHTQDMYDQAGDTLRGRRTVPLCLSDKLSRVTIAIPVAFWSWFGPWFWNSGIMAYIVPLGLGSTIVLRTLTMKNVEDDKRTFLIWNIWLVALYSLPLFTSVIIG